MSKELAADYFSRHLSSNECHITSDGRVFHSKGTADGFANGLKDNTVDSYTRAQIEAPAVEDLEDDTSGEEKVQALEALKNYDATTAEYSETKALVKALGLETENQKEVTLVAALEAYKVVINTEVKQ